MAFKLDYKVFELPFKYPFTISKGTKTVQPTLMVRLQWNRLIGIGEAPAIDYYDVSTTKMTTVLEQKRLFIEKFAFTEPERYWHYLHHLLPQDPFLVCALDMAAWDLFAQIQQQPLYKYWGTALSDAPVTNYTIGIAPIAAMIKKIQENPWPVYKIKLGTADDLGLLHALRAVTDAPFRVDVNAGWTLEQALGIIPQLPSLGVELIEQPLARDNWEGMQQLLQISSIPFIADESCVFENDITACAGYFHGVNIKLTKCSGITPALRMIKAAKALNLKVMLGNMNECSIGTAAIGNLAPQVDYVDADGPLLLAEDPGKGMIHYVNHRVVVNL